MAETLKSRYGPDVPLRIAEKVAEAYPEFDQEEFLRLALDGFEDLELTERAKQISSALAATLPPDRDRAIRILMSSIEPKAGEAEPTGMDAFVYFPLVYFVGQEGLGCFETSMWAQKELTKRFTAEFSIRGFIDKYPSETLARLRDWAEDRDVHVRRLVSEGTRPRLPWAPHLKRFRENPAPVIELLEFLKDDPEEYVRRSVANNLNDISKDHPEVAVDVARRWWKGGSEERRKLVRHGLRTLIKKGHKGALGVLGFGEESPVEVEVVTCDPEEVEIGGKVQIRIGLVNPSETRTGALVDFRIHFVKANGSTSPKVFKGAERYLGPGERITLRKTVSVAQQSTRTHYPGRHEVEVMLNGRTHPGGHFVLQKAKDR